MNPAQNLGAFILEQRILQDRAQGDVAEKAHVAQGTISRLENGGGNLNWDTALRILETLGFEVHIVPKRANKLKASRRKSA